MKKQWIILTAILMAAALAAPLFAVEKKIFKDARRFARAGIVKIERSKPDENNPYDIEVGVHLRILDGEQKGESHVVTFSGDDNMPKEMFYREGDTVFIGISVTGGSEGVEYIHIYDVDNSKGIIFFGVVLLAAILLVGRIRGIMSILAFIATIFLIFYLLIPMTLEGNSPLPVAVAICIAAIIITIPIILGFKKKTIAAIAGASSGILIATFLALLAGWIMRLTGIVTNEMMTVFYASVTDIDLRGLALSSIIIAALGAIMDVCISIASAAEEIFKVHPEISFGQAFKSVITVSSDMLGATLNTLLFAYVGTSLPLVLLIALKMEPGIPLTMVLNYNPVLSELIKSAVGCIGMFLSMPVTAIICIKLHGGVRTGADNAEREIIG
ncbi:MAG TPA: YibE/F family protein [Spirochaetota bacterium]|mgnify:CR=1 FL=1|nr:YibE/F family protein [Spirochaetota bacterium]